ncbi:protein of unknown function (plasmid) [Agrobacterium pusense]|uniref:Uncharacterized protein n=1 Tax=Agrobacterium pusense TaxID=648995 RepID=U4Q3W3_9HYPH|nr:protein of unknown function [Agrobacterium pusense]
MAAASMRKPTIMIGDNGDLVRGFGQLGPIAGDQPLAKAVKCDWPVCSEALRSLTLASRRIAYPIFRLSETMTRYLHRFRRFASATAPGGAPVRQNVPSVNRARRASSAFRITLSSPCQSCIWNSFWSRPTSENRCRFTAPL